MAERNMDVIKLDEFPSNSHKSKEKKKEVVESKKIIKGKVSRKKETLGRRVKDEFISEDSKGVFEYLLTDVFIPAAKDTIMNLISGGIEMMLYGTDDGGYRRDRRGRDRNRTRVSYDSYYDRNDRRSERRSRRNTHRIDDVIFDSRAEAEDVLSTMIDYIDTYDFVTIGHFYDMVGESTTPGDFKWGWERLGDAKVVREREGYVISTPRPIAND